MTTLENTLSDAGARPPCVSVVIGVFNQGKFVEQAINSVLQQSYTNFECVIIDDMSADDSVAIIEQCLRDMQDDRFRLISMDENRGQMVTMLTGLDATNGPFVAFLDGDDIWGERFLEHHVGVHLNPAGSAAISSSDMVVIDAANTVLTGGHVSFHGGDPRHYRVRNKIIHTEGEGEETVIFLERGATNWLWSATSGMMFRRQALDAMRPIDPAAIPICADYYWAHAAHLLGGTIRLERPLSSYRVHGGNSWANDRVFGEGSEPGNAPEGMMENIRAAMVHRYCLAAPDLEAIIPRRQLVKSLIALVGWEGAFALHKSDPAARQLLGDWPTPWRKFVLKCTNHLPRFMLPKRLRRLKRQEILVNDI